MGIETSKPVSLSFFIWIARRSALLISLFFVTTIALTFIGSVHAQTSIPSIANSPLRCLVPEAGAPSCATQTSPGSTAVGFSMPQHVGNPINVVTGNKYQYELDYQSVNSGLALSRHYNSTLAAYNTGLGPGWRHSYQVVLTRVSATQLNVVQSDGRLIQFYLEPDTTTIYKPITASDGYIETAENTTWYLVDGREMMFQGSFLVRINMGEKLGILTLAYKSERLKSVTDSNGGSLQFSYVEQDNVLPQYGSGISGKPIDVIDSISLPNGQNIRYEYANYKNLISVIYPDKIMLNYAYQNNDWTSHLTNRISAADGIDSRWSYDSRGKAIGWQEGANKNGLEIVRLVQNLSTDNLKDVAEKPSYASVTYADGRESNYSWIHTKTSKSSDDTAVDLACDNCLPEDISSAANSIEWEPPTQNEYDVAMDSFWSSLQPDLSSDDRTNGTTTYNGIYPHADGNIRISVNVSRTGKVKDFSIGDFSLTDIIRETTQDDIATCNEGTHFQTSETFSHDRIQKLGSGAESCALDSLVAVEFIYRVENFKTSIGNSTVPDDTRRKSSTAVPWYHPMRRYCSLPAGMTCTDLEDDLKMAELSQCAYGNVSCQPAFRLVNAKEVGMLNDRFSDQGFDAQLYHDLSQNRYILVFRGTDDTGDDWEANFDQARGDHTRQYDLALNLAKDLTTRIGNATLEFAGHSLGGGLATLAALQTRGTATVFNAASLQPTTAGIYGLDSSYQNASTYIRHIHTDFDPITVLQERADDLNWGDMQTVPGIQLEVPNPDHPWMNLEHDKAPTFVQGLAPVLWHKIEAVIHVLQSLIKYNCSP